MARLMDLAAVAKTALLAERWCPASIHGRRPSVLGHGLNESSLAKTNRPNDVLKLIALFGRRLP
jgi:hypothetical protein